MFARQGIDGIAAQRVFSNLIFSMKQSQVFHFLFSSLGFSFVFSFFGVYLFIATRNSHIDLLVH